MIGNSHNSLCALSSELLSSVTARPKVPVALHPV